MNPAAPPKTVSPGFTRRIMENSVALFTSQLLSKIFRVLANFLLARFLGPENFGAWALVLSFTELFRFLPDFGLDRTLVRRMARGESSYGVAVNLSLRAVFSALAVLAAGTALFFTSYPQEIKQLIYFYSLSLFLQAGASTFASYFQAQLKSVSLLWAYTLSGLLYLGLILAGIFANQGITFFIASLLLTEGLLLAHFALTFFKKGGKLASFNLSELPPVIKEAFPLALCLATGAIYFRIDTLFVYHFTGERGAGLYSACFRLSEAFLMLATAAAASLFPVFSRLKLEGKSELASLFSRSFFWFLSPALLLGILMMGASPFIIHFVYGEAFAPSAPGLSIIIWSVVFMFANILCTQAIVASDREKSIVKITLANVLANLGLNFWLVPKYGFIGACWAILETEAFSFLLQTWILQKILSPRLLARMGPHFIVPALAVLWYCCYPSSFQSAGLWLLTFGYLVFLLDRRGTSA